MTDSDDPIFLHERRNQHLSTSAVILHRHLGSRQMQYLPIRANTDEGKPTMKDSACVDLQG